MYRKTYSFGWKPWSSPHIFKPVQIFPPPVFQPGLLASFPWDVHFHGLVGDTVLQRSPTRRWAATAMVVALYASKRIYAIPSRRWWIPWGKNMTTDVHLILGSKCLELQETITTFPFESVLARKGNTSSYCGGWWHPLFTVPSGHQTWLAGKSPISGGLNVRKSPIICGFSIAVVPDRRVNVLIFGYSGKTPMYGSKARSSGFFFLIESTVAFLFGAEFWSVLI